MQQQERVSGAGGHLNSSRGQPSGHRLLTPASAKLVKPRSHPWCKGANLHGHLSRARCLKLSNTQSIFCNCVSKGGHGLVTVHMGTSGDNLGCCCLPPCDNSLLFLQSSGYRTGALALPPTSHRCPRYRFPGFTWVLMDVHLMLLPTSLKSLMSLTSLCTQYPSLLCDNQVIFLACWG